MHVLRASSQLISVWGSAACHSSRMAVTHSLVARTPGTSQTEQRSERQSADVAFAPVPPRCLLVFSIVQRLWHMGMLKAPALLPHTADAGSSVLWRLCIHFLKSSGQFAVPLPSAIKDADPSLPPPWSPTPRVCD